MTISIDNSLRKVAILVASLDEASSEQILASLPPQQARIVRQQVAILTDIDADEQRDIVDEFRKSLSRTVARPEIDDAGVELDASLLERLEREDYSTAKANGFEGLNDADMQYLVEMLAGESTQTIAVVLARLEANQAAEILATFAPSQQREILRRLEYLDTTDEHSVQLVEAQVNHWIASQRERRRRMVAGKQMVDRIVSRTPSAKEESVVVATRIPKTSSRIASAYASITAETPRNAIPAPVRYQPIQAPPQNLTPANPFDHLSAVECQGHLEKLSDSTLMAALSRCDADVVTLALLGVSDKLLKRVLRGLPRRAALQFRQQLHDIGPTRISDILSAQQEILNTASQLN